MPERTKQIVELGGAANERILLGEGGLRDKLRVLRARLAARGAEPGEAEIAFRTGETRQKALRVIARSM